MYSESKELVIKEHILVKYGILRMGKKISSGVISPSQSGDGYEVLFETSEELHKAASAGLLDSFIHEMVACYRESIAYYFYGNGYLVCSSSKCRGQLGLFDIVNKNTFDKMSLSTFEKEQDIQSESFQCPVCHSKMKFSFDQDETFNFFHASFSKADLVVSMLFDESGKLTGFTYGSFSTLRDVWNSNHINHFPEKPTPYTDGSIASIYKVDVKSLDKPVFHFSTWGVTSKLSRRIDSFTILFNAVNRANTIARSRGYSSLKFIAKSLEDSPALRIYKILGCEIVWRSQIDDKLAVSGDLMKLANSRYAKLITLVNPQLIDKFFQ